MRRDALQRDAKIRGGADPRTALLYCGDAYCELRWCGAASDIVIVLCSVG